MVGKKALPTLLGGLMSQYRRAIIPGATYFFTLVTYRRRPILCDPLALGHIGWAMLCCPPC